MEPRNVSCLIEIVNMTIPPTQMIGRIIILLKAPYSSKAKLAAVSHFDNNYYATKLQFRRISVHTDFTKLKFSDSLHEAN